jgi:hypothetical protein
LSLLTVLVIVFGILPASPVIAAAASPSLADFKVAVKNTDPAKLVGVFVKDIMAVRVVQQSSPNFVSTITGTVTQFGLASQYGSIGLLAHNYLSGSDFSKLQMGTVIVLVFGNGDTKEFTVTAVKKYQALNPDDPYSDFIDLNEPDTDLSSTDLFKQTYGTRGALVMQTCINNNGDPSWGRLFIIATPSA